MYRKFSKSAIISLLITLIIAFTSSCGRKNEAFVSEKFAFNTFFQVVIYDDTREERELEAIMDHAYAIMSSIDRKYNSKVATSVIGRFNAHEINEIILDDTLREIFGELTKAFDISNGKYDVTIAPLMHVWGMDTEMENITSLPSSEALSSAIAKIGYENLNITNEKITNNADVTIDTGSFLKGYALHKMREYLEASGIKSAMMSCVSSIETIGVKPDGSPWRIGIQNPDDPSSLIGVVNLTGESLSISGNYQIFVEINGERYHHILDKATGYPVNDKKMVAIKSHNGFADMYSTCFFLMDKDKVLEYASSHDDTEVFIIDSENNIFQSERFNFIKD